jgi:CPA2 family monovalent cation:H+ antiporter-2
MEHGTTLIATVAVALGLALVAGLVAVKLRLPAIVGYLLAGVLIGPFTPGYVADSSIADQLAEIGVMLLMFGVGLHFSLDDLFAVRKIALPGAILQILAATALGAGVGTAWGWPLGAAVIFGLALSVASTVVLLRALEAQGLVASVNGQIAVGWLVVEDLVTVLVLVLLPPLAGVMGGKGAAADPLALAITLGVTFAKIAAFVTIMLVVGRRLFPWLLWHVAGTGSRELFTLCVVAAALSLAFGAAELFGVSFALGAFFAGMVMQESELSHRAAEETTSIRDAFTVLFFVSVGMLFDPMILVEDPVRVGTVVAIIVLGKSVVAAALVLAFRYPLNTALTVSAGLAQIGEFSFILAGLGQDLGLLSTEAESLVLAGAIISISINPLVFKAMAPVQAWLRKGSSLARKLEHPETPLAELPLTTADKYLKKQVVLVGYGRVGRRIGTMLTMHDIPFVVADENHETVELLRGNGIPAVAGDASDPSVLLQAHIKDASMLVIATSDILDVRSIIATARSVNPAIEIVIRTHDEEESLVLEREQAGKVFFGEGELAAGMARHVLERYGRNKLPPPAFTETALVVDDARQEASPAAGSGNAAGSMGDALDKPDQAELADLILAVADGDRGAYKQLYDRTAPKLFGIVLRMIRDRSLAEDILQDVFLRVWRNAGNFAPEAGGPMAWLSSIARNRTIDVLRQKSLVLPGHDDSETDWQQMIADPRDPEADFMDISALRHCLSEIDEPARGCVLLAYYEGYSRDELAVRFGRPVNTIKTWLHRSLLALKSCLESLA